MTTNTQIALYQGVEVEQAVYMAAFSQENGLQEIINQITQQAKAQAIELSGDINIKKNRTALSSLARTVASAKVSIDDTGKSLVEDAKAKIKIVDNNRKNVRDSLDALRDEIRKPVTEWEEAKKAEEAALEAEKALIKTLSQAIDENGNRKNSIQLREDFEKISQRIQSDNADIQAAAKDALNQLEQHIQAAEQYEAQQTEIARLEAEKAAREKAEYEAKIAAEAAEREKQAMQERMEVEKKAAAEAERMRIEAEQREIQEAEAKRAQDIEYKRQINREIYNVMISCEIEETAAKAFLLKLQNGEVPHLKICY